MFRFFLDELSSFKENYPFIYNKEVEEEGDEVRLGYSEMQAFTDEYGAYMEMIYILLDGKLIDMEKVFKMEAHSFLFRVQYLLRKRKIENDEQRKVMNQNRSYK